MKSARVTLCQYDMETDKKINEYTGTANQIFRKIENYRDYYYRLKMYENTSRDKVEEEYLGLRAINIGSLNITRGDHLNARLNEYIQTSITENNKRYNNQTLENLIYWYFTIEAYVLNRKKLDLNDFNKSLDKFLLKNKDFKEITDLGELKGKSGIYVMVLEQYRGFYVGQSKDIRKRIQRHWNRKDYFTGTGIDFYKAKDTTKIYAKVIDEIDLDAYEKLYLKDLYKYSLNGIPAGSLDTITMGDLSELYENQITGHYNFGDWIVEQEENNLDLFLDKE